MSLTLQTKAKRKLPPVPARALTRALSWVGEEGITVRDTRIKPDLDRFARLPPHILAQLKKVENDNTIIPGQKFTDIPVTDHDDVTHDKITKKGMPISIHLKRDTFRRIAGIREFADDRNSYLIRKVEVRKNPEKSLGFYICEGDGWDRKDGIFVSRLVLGSYMEANGFLRVGDEILKVNEVCVKNFALSDVALMMQVVEKLVLTVKVLTSVSHMRRHSTRLSISSKTLSSSTSSSTQFTSSTTENTITLTAPKPQVTTDVPFTHNLAEKVDAKTNEADPPVAQGDEQPSTGIKKSSSDSSLMLSVSQALEEGFKMLDNSTVTVVDVHNSMTQDGNKHAPQISVSPTAVVVDLNKSTTSDQKTDHEVSLEMSNSNEQDSSDDGDSDDVEKSDDDNDDTDFSLFRKFKRRKKAKKKIPETSDTYEIKKSFWQMQEDSISMHDKIDPIRDMQDTSTTFTGKKANEFNTKVEELERLNNHTSSTSADHNDSSSYGSTVKIKVKSLSNISSFTPQNLFCCILVDGVRKAVTNVKSIQGTTVDFNEELNIDFLSGASELQIAICKSSEVGGDEHIICDKTVELPGVNKMPEEFSIEIDPMGVLTMDIQVLPLESVLN